MNAQEYIINNLNLLVTFFPSLTFKYKYDKVKLTHIIEVEPLDEFKNNEEYLMVEATIVYEFDNKFIPETILFVSQDSLTRVVVPDLVFKGNTMGLFIGEFCQEQTINFEEKFNTIEVDTIVYALAA